MNYKVRDVSGKRRSLLFAVLCISLLLCFFQLKWQRENQCHFIIATLATDKYMSHVNDLRKSILSVTNQNCFLRVIYGGTESELFNSKVTNASNDYRAYRNPFAGIDTKVKAVLRILAGSPNGSILLWIDASVLLLNSTNLDASLLIESYDMLFIRERRYVDRLNLGVIIMRNSDSVRHLLIETVSVIQRGYWDQGIISCALGSKFGPKVVEKNCSQIGVMRNREIRWSFLPDSFALTAKVSSDRSCTQKINGTSPTFLKFTGDKMKRFQCFKEFKRCLKMSYGFKYIKSSRKMRIAYDSAHMKCLGDTSLT